jgi:hypothetical protein
MKKKSVKKASAKKKAAPKRKASAKPKAVARKKVAIKKKVAVKKKSTAKSVKPAARKVKKVLKPATVKTVAKKSTTPMTDLILERMRTIDGRNK